MKRGMLFDKKGQGLSVNAIILIILGIVVLVVLILGFTIGWSRLLPFVSSNNVENIKTACSVACSTGNTYDFCTQPRTLKAGGEEEIDTNCNALSDPENKEVYGKYGIEACSQITCG